MAAYRITARILETGNGRFFVGVSAALENDPRGGVITRDHECGSRSQAEDFREILVDQVKTGVEAAGGHVVGVDFV